MFANKKLLTTMCPGDAYAHQATHTHSQPLFLRLCMILFLSLVGMGSAWADMKEISSTTIFTNFTSEGISNETWISYEGSTYNTSGTKKYINPSTDENQNNSSNQAANGAQVKNSVPITLSVTGANKVTVYAYHTNSSASRNLVVQTSDDNKSTVAVTAGTAVKTSLVLDASENNTVTIKTDEGSGVYVYAVKLECSGSTPPASTYTVTYNGNGNTGGSVPTDATNYASGASVTVLGNTGSLVKTGYTFDGWNTAANGSGTSYAAGANFSISANTTLYAKWMENAPVSADFTMTTPSSAPSDIDNMEVSGGSISDKNSATKALTFNSNGVNFPGSAAQLLVTLDKKIQVGTVINIKYKNTSSDKTTGLGVFDENVQNAVINFNNNIASSESSTKTYTFTASNTSYIGSNKLVITRNGGNGGLAISEITITNLGEETTTYKTTVSVSDLKYYVDAKKDYGSNGFNGSGNNADRTVAGLSFAFGGGEGIKINNGTQITCRNNTGTITIAPDASNSSKKITKVEFTGSNFASNTVLTANVAGTFAVEGTTKLTFTATTPASSITFTNNSGSESSNAIQITQFDVYTDGELIANNVTPTIGFASASQNVQASSDPVTVPLLASTPKNLAGFTYDFNKGETDAIFDAVTRTITPGAIAGTCTLTVSMAAQAPYFNAAADAVFTLNISNQHNVSATAGANGTVTLKDGSDNAIENPSAVDNGATVKFVATPDHQYKFVNWTNAGGTEVSTEYSYSATVNSDLALTANFAALSPATIGITGTPALTDNAITVDKNASLKLSGTYSATNGGQIYGFDQSSTGGVKVNNGQPFRWQTCNADGTGASDISGATKNFYDVPTTEAGTKYYRFMVVEECSNNAGGRTYKLTYSDPIAVTVVVPTIGNTDCTDAWGSNVTSTAAALEVGQTVTFSFTNHNNGGSEWNNWNLVSGTNETKPYDGNSTALRSDAWYWGNGESGTHTSTSGDWSTMSQANMDGAHVDVMVSKYDDHVVTYYAVMTLKDGKKAMLDLSQYYSESPTPTYAWLRVDQSYITDLEITTSDIVYHTVSTTKNDNDGGAVAVTVKDTNTPIENGGDVIEGTTVKFTATPADWYMFDNWHDGTAYVGDNSGTYAASITANTTIQANFARYYKVNVVANNAEYGDVNITGGTNNVAIKKGTNITLTASANDGYSFVKWVVGTTDRSTETSFSNKIENIISGAANDKEIVTITAVFEQDVTLTASDLRFNSTSQLATNNNRWTPKNGETLNLAEILETTSTGAMTYQSDNTAVATVSDAGVVTAGSATGTATITVTQDADATYKQGMLTFTVDVIPNKSDASSNAYTVANDDKVSNGIQIIRKDITMTYGGENFWGIGAQDSHGSYIASLTNPVVSNNVPSAGTFYKFTATKSGTLSVDIKGGQGKVLAVSKNGTLIDYKDLDGKNISAGTKFSASYLGDVTFSVEAGIEYYMYCTNSKLAVYGFEFLPNAIVTLNANGGTGSMAAIEAEVGSDVAISHNTFTGPNATPYFVGWNTKTDGTGTAYSDGDMVQVTGDITLYAQWSASASRGVTLLSYTVTDAVIKKNVVYPADEGTISQNVEKTPSKQNGVYSTKVESSQYIKCSLPEGYTLQEGDIITLKSTSGTKTYISSSEITESNKDKVSNKISLTSLTYTVTASDVLNGNRDFYIARQGTFYFAGVSVYRPAVPYCETTTDKAAITVTFDPVSGSALTEGKVKVLGNDKTDAMYVMWSTSPTVTEADVCKAENLHQINPVYTTPTLSGNVYLHVVPANYNAGTPTRGNIQTANYKMFVDPVLTVSDMTTSAQIAGLTPNYAVTYNNGVEDVTVSNPAVTFALKAGQATDVISISGTTITGLKEGKVVVVASYAGDHDLCLNEAQTEFTVNVDLHLYFKAQFENNVNFVTADKGDDPIDLPTFTIKDASGRDLTKGTDYTMSAYQLQEGSDAEIIDLANKQVNTRRPGCAMVKITLTPAGSYSGTYETTNIYIPVMVEETDATKYYAVAKDETFKLLKSVERNGCTMTFGGWTGYYQDGKTLDGTANGNSGNATYGSVGYHSNDDKAENGGFTQDRWDNASDISKQTISTLFRNVTSGSHNKNPRNETATNPYSTTETAATHNYVRNDQTLGGTSNAAYDLFSVPCRGAYVKFEPKVDGIVTLHINQKTILEDNTHEFSNGRYFQVKDERGKFVMPRTYCSNTATIKTPRYADFKVGASGKLDNDYLMGAIGNFQQEYELNQVLKIGYTVTEAPNFATLYECPVTYSFDVKAGKTYYAYCVVSKMDVAGFEFHTEENNPSAINKVTLNENGTINGAAPVTDNVINQASITYNRSITAGNWNPIVLPYSMNEHQVKYVFGNGEETWRNSAEILYFDHIDNTTGTMYFMNHFYKTIVAGVPCLVRPTKDVTSLSLAGCDYPYVTVETPEPMIIGAGEKGDGYNFSSAYTQQQIEIGDYYFSATSGIKQKTSGSASTLKGFRGVIKAPSPTQAKVYSVSILGFDEEESGSSTTDMPFIILDEDGNMSVTTSDNIYNMNGQIVRAGSSDVTGLPKGIYIVNNKKVFIK